MKITNVSYKYLTKKEILDVFYFIASFLQSNLRQVRIHTCAYMTTPKQVLIPPGRVCVRDREGDERAQQTGCASLVRTGEP